MSDTVESSVEVTPISRQNAIGKLRGMWAEQRSRLDGRFKKFLSEPGWERCRNYELETDMSEWFGGEWVISEWCPFDGVYCRWPRHIPEGELISAIERMGGAEARWLRKMRAER